MSNTVNEGFTPAEARQAAELFPDIVHHVEPDGTPVLRVTKAELLELWARIPLTSMFRDVTPAPKGATPEQVELLRRYPSMAESILKGGR